MSRLSRWNSLSFEQPKALEWLMITSYEATMLSRMAEEARSVANDMRDRGQKLYMLQIAARYAALAKRVESERPGADEAPTK
jgi:hypothetical protein